MGLKFIIPSLMSVAVNKYNETIKATDFCPQDLAIATTITYKTGSDREPAIKNAVLASIVKHSSKIMKEPEIREAIDMSDQLAVAVIEALANHYFCHSSYKGCSGDGLAQDQCGICQSWRQARCSCNR
ncbi:uncharacterized protein K489DRAFT_381430 [Dissoconium aciculare CBS 342.82]|uniref:Uncharacterized protein n=1 Tax=Dissoconium aciculare CBS 342.82 TaxID=1314786 RepID=A0A6J3M0K1_9PEZI|nr:uncharacterized protein K489DRAFT_381430 [Dissoconium aciculare CBS 342.82]KAF1821438.1 hypothetical protein K489DRAFT_381430 [Dissoconium aciculare CBS 342.82]